MLFSLKQKNTIKSLKIWNITIKSKVYSYKDFLKFIRQDESFILSCSAFQISIWRKEKETFYVKDFQDIKFLYSSFVDKQNKEIFLNYIKWRLAVLGRLLKQYNIEEINIKQFFQFLFIEANLEIINKLSYLFNFKENYNLQDLKNFYKSCCNYNKQNKDLLNYLSSIYKIDLHSFNVINNTTKKQDKILIDILKALSEEFDLPITIIRTYQKSLDKFRNYVIHKNIEWVNTIKQLIKQYKNDNDIVFTVENIIRNKKTKEEKPKNFLDNDDFKISFKMKKIKL